MELKQYGKTYQEYKRELDTVLQQTAEGFVRIGYLLKVARDTNVLAESGYKSMAEFAQAEYNLDKTQVSRFISINDRFSENGYSDKLLPNYQGFGYAKLTIMLQLPEEIAQELPKSLSKAEVQAVKEEVEAEKKITDIEVMLEEKPEEQEESHDERWAVLHAAIRQAGEDDPELYEAIAHSTKEQLKMTLAPDGDKIYSVRVPGTGRLMIYIKEDSNMIKIGNIRTGEKQGYSLDEVADMWKHIGATPEDTQEAWEKQYQKPFPGKTQEPEKKHTKVEKAKTEKKPKEQQKEQEKEQIKEQEDKKAAADNLPGQMQIEDYPEVMPKPVEESPQSRISTGAEDTLSTESDKSVENMENKSPENLNSTPTEDTLSTQNIESVENEENESPQSRISTEAGGDFKDKEELQQIVRNIMDDIAFMKRHIWQKEWTALSCANSIKTKLMICRDKEEENG